MSLEKCLFSARPLRPPLPGASPISIAGFPRFYPLFTGRANLIASD